MTHTLFAFAANPFAELYAAQASTYLVAALLYQKAGHRGLALCCGASAMVHSILAALHCFAPIG